MKAYRWKTCTQIIPTEYSNPSVTKAMIEDDIIRRSKLLAEPQQRMLMGDGQQHPHRKAHPLRQLRIQKNHGRYLSGKSLTQWRNGYIQQG